MILISPRQLPYGSNEEEEITHLYMGHALRSYCDDINTFVLAGTAVGFDAI